MRQAGLARRQKRPKYLESHFPCQPVMNWPAWPDVENALSARRDPPRSLLVEDPGWSEKNIFLRGVVVTAGAKVHLNMVGRRSGGGFGEK